jgi:hypothetical protein
MTARVVREVNHAQRAARGWVDSRATVSPNRLWYRAIGCFHVHSSVLQILSVSFAGERPQRPD